MIHKFSGGLRPSRTIPSGVVTQDASSLDRGGSPLTKVGAESRHGEAIGSTTLGVRGVLGITDYRPQSRAQSSSAPTLSKISGSSLLIEQGVGHIALETKIPGLPLSGKESTARSVK